MRSQVTFEYLVIVSQQILHITSIMLYHYYLLPLLLVTNVTPWEMMRSQVPLDYFVIVLMITAVEEDLYHRPFRLPISARWKRLAVKTMKASDKGRGLEAYEREHG